MKALFTDYSPPSPLHLLISSMRLDLSIFAKRFSQSLAVQRDRLHTGLTIKRKRHGRDINEMPTAISPCVRKAADVAAHALPGDPSLWNFISGQMTPKPGLLLLLHHEKGELGDGRGKSSLLWIVIIGLLTSTTPPPFVTKNARSRVPVLVARRAVCKVIQILYSSLRIRIAFLCWPVRVSWCEFLQLISDLI